MKKNTPLLNWITRNIHYYYFGAFPFSLSFFQAMNLFVSYKWDTPSTFIFAFLGFREYVFGIDHVHQIFVSFLGLINKCLSLFSGLPCSQIRYTVCLASALWAGSETEHHISRLMQWGQCSPPSLPSSPDAATSEVIISRGCGHRPWGVGRKAWD